MKKLISMILFAGLVLDVAASTQAQTVSGNRFVVSFSDPSRPGLLKVNLFNNGITVRSYNGKEIIIETTSRPRRGRPDTTPDGLKRIDIDMAGLTIEEENNVMSVSARRIGDSGNLEIQVPLKTNLNLRTVNGGNIVVEGVEGEIEVSNTNGGVTLNNVAGSVVAHATNGRVVASLRDITPNKPMSFTSQNSNLDITLPANAKANLRMRTNNGEIWSDFEIQLQPTTPTVQGRPGGGGFRIETDQTRIGTINGGGPDFDLRTLNGNIYIRRAK
jgi:hypothetical protein